ncbi:MAG TPA: methyltransferase domain-containing protein, partial [Candidatus Aminicenantes bacterium]|nr:methyltransferase domain-containing protein [Candidatus Aminicenantes bacterium]
MTASLMDAARSTEGLTKSSIWIIVPNEERRSAAGEDMGPFFKLKKRPAEDPGVSAGHPKNPYDEGWSAYSDQWETAVKSEEMKYLGDEWGSGELTEGIIQEFVIPFLVPDGTALEIGCGGGKYSEWLAHLHRKLVCSDVSEKMVQRTKA